MTDTRRTIFAFCLLSALVPLISVDTPRGLAFAPGIIALLCYIPYYLSAPVKPVISKQTVGLVLIIFSMASLSLLWALHFETSLRQIPKLAGLLPPQILLISLAISFKKEELRPYIHYFAYGLIAAVLLLCFEIITHGFFFNVARGLPTDNIADPDEFNRSTVALSLYSFSALTFLKTKLKNPLWGLLIMAPLAVAIYMTESQSAQLAFFAGLFFLFAFPYRQKWAWKTLIALILICTFAAPFVVTYIYRNFAQDIQDIQFMAQASAGHRLEIWDYISRYALQSPILGYGIEMTRDTTFDSRQIFICNNSVLHPHNYAIQVWAEFGLIGILITIALLYKLFTTIETRLSVAQQKIILPTLMATMMPASFAYGMWQSWWIGLLFHTASLCLIAVKFTDEDKKEETAV